MKHLLYLDPLVSHLIKCRPVYLSDDDDDGDTEVLDYVELVDRSLRYVYLHIDQHHYIVRVVAHHPCYHRVRVLLSPRHVNEGDDLGALLRDLLPAKVSQSVDVRDLPVQVKPQDLMMHRLSHSVQDIMFVLLCLYPGEPSPVVALPTDKHTQERTLASALATYQSDLDVLLHLSHFGVRTDLSLGDVVTGARETSLDLLQCDLHLQIVSQ